MNLTKGYQFHLERNHVQGGIIRRRPAFAKGDRVAYSDEEEPGRLHRDTLCMGKGVVVEDSTNDDREVRTQWYTEEENGTYSLSPLIWNLPVKKCYLLDGNNIHGEMVLAPSKAESMYITTDIDPGGLGSSVVQYIPTGLLVAGSIPARGSPLFT